MKYTSSEANKLLRKLNEERNALIEKDNPGKPFDGGFRVFKLDESNMNDVSFSCLLYSSDGADDTR